jgi:hypothetical protein
MSGEKQEGKILGPRTKEGARTRARARVTTRASHKHYKSKSKGNNRVPVYRCFQGAIMDNKARTRAGTCEAKARAKGGKNEKNTEDSIKKHPKSLRLLPQASIFLSALHNTRTRYIRKGDADFVASCSGGRFSGRLKSCY